MRIAKLFNTSTETGDTAETASYCADIELQDYGAITVALDAEAVSETVASFVSLAESVFYDGPTPTGLLRSYDAGRRHHFRRGAARHHLHHHPHPGGGEQRPVTAFPQ